MPDADSTKGRGGPGLFAKLAALIGGGDDPERRKKRLLREYASRLHRARPRLYNTRAGTADPAMGALFHSFYRVLGPARILLKNATVSAVLRSLVVEKALSDPQREILHDLSAEALTARAEALDGPAYVDEVRGKLKAFMGGFDRKTVDRAKRVYHAVLVLVDLANFDYWTVLRRFDARYPEADFTYTPRFLPLDADYVRDALKDFLEVIGPVEPDLDWTQALAILKEFRGMELVGAAAWSGLLRSVGDVKKSGSLLAIVRLMDADTEYAPRARPPEGKLVEPYVASVRSGVEATVRRAVDAKRQQGIESLGRRVFGDRELPRLANYTAVLGEKLAKKGLPGLGYIGALGYTKAYLIEIHKTRVKQTVDALLIRGTWRELTVSRSLSNCYQEPLAVLNELVEFDRKLGDNQDLGVKLKAAVTRADHARPQTLTQARQVLERIETLARGYVTRLAQQSVAFGQILRVLVEDSGSQNPKLVANWQELRGSGPGDDVKEQMVAIFQTLQALVQLLKLSAGRAAAPAGVEAAETAPATEPAAELPPDLA
jgi:hypothetical protein